MSEPGHLSTQYSLLHFTRNDSNGTLTKITPKAAWPPDRPNRSDQSDFLELGGDDVLVERLHDVFVGTGMQRARDVGDIVLGGAEHHLGRVATGHAAQIAEEFVAVHHGHVPVEQDRLGHGAL